VSNVGDEVSNMPGRRLLAVAPEWITVLEAAFAADVPQDLLRAWVDAGRIEGVSLLGGNDPVGTLVRTMDVRAVLALGPGVATVTAAMAPHPGSAFEAGPRPAWKVNRRRMLVVCGTALLGGLLPVRALAGSGRASSGTEESARVRVRAGAARDVSEASADEDRGRPTRGRAPTIQSVTVEPDPVGPGGEAVITINASPARWIVSYSITASEGALAQDPRHPWIWTWRQA